MLIAMLETTGITRNHASFPVPGKWNTVDEFNYHVPCKDFLRREWSSPVGKHLLFRSPAIFMYRNPLDIVASESVWYQKNSIPFSHFLRTLGDPDEKLLALIEGNPVIENIRSRMNKYIGWMNFSNVIPVSYEELVGSKGGGSDTEQIRTIWSLQLKLHIPGSPEKIATKLYDDQNSPTFFKGKIGRHKEIFKKLHYDRFKILHQDFMEKMGYEINHIGTPRFVERFRGRPLQFWRCPKEELWEQRLVRESYLHHNIVAVAGGYATISQDQGSIDLSRETLRSQTGVNTGFASIEDASHFLILKECDAMLERKISELERKILDRYEWVNIRRKQLKSKKWFQLLHRIFKLFDNG